MAGSDEAALGRTLAGKTLLIFDLDGTLADSSPLHARAFNAAFASYGIEVDYETVAGVTTDVAVGLIAQRAALPLSAEQAEALVAEKRRLAAQLIETELCALEGSVEFVRRVRGSHLVSLCTSGSKANAHASLRRLGIDECFDSVFAAEDVRSGKPAPDLFLKALDHHRVAPESAIIFEDSDAGVAAAMAAGVDVIRIVTRDPGDGQATWAMLNAGLAGAA